MAAALVAMKSGAATVPRIERPAGCRSGASKRRAAVSSASAGSDYVQALHRVRHRPPGVGSSSHAIRPARVAAGEHADRWRRGWLARCAARAFHRPWRATRSANLARSSTATAPPRRALVEQGAARVFGAILAPAVEPMSRPNARRRPFRRKGARSAPPSELVGRRAAGWRRRASFGRVRRTQQQRRGVEVGRSPPKPRSDCARIDPSAC